MKKKPYSDSLSGEDQVDAEEIIASAIFKFEPKSWLPPRPPKFGEEDCQELGRDILYKVLQKFRPDVFVKIPDEEACCQIVMTSDEFGTEYFSYNDLEEAHAGFERLKKSCTKFQKKDGIKRTLRLVVREWEGE